MVGVAGFELATPCTPCKCATRLRYTPTRPRLYVEKNANFAVWQCFRTLANFELLTTVGEYRTWLAKQLRNFSELFWCAWQTFNYVVSFLMGIIFLPLKVAVTHEAPSMALATHVVCSCITNARVQLGFTHSKEQTYGDDESSGLFGKRTH